MNDYPAEYDEDLEAMSDWEDFEEDDDEVYGIGYESDAFNLAENILAFINATPELTPSAQAELLGAFVLDAGRSGEVDWGRVAQGVQTGLSLFQTGAQIAGGIAGAVGGNNRTARDISRWSRRLGQGAGFAQNILGGIRPGQTARLPAGVQRVVQAGRPYVQRLRTPAARTGRRPPARTRTVAPTRAPGRQPLNNTAQFASLLNNPQIMQALRSALLRGREAALHVETDIVSGMPVEIPMSEVMKVLANLANEAAIELDALEGGDAAEVPEYLVGEDGELIIDPECAEEREALVLENLILQGEFVRYAGLDGSVGMEGIAGSEMDDSEAWAREAGFDI